MIEFSFEKYMDGAIRAESVVADSPSTTQELIIESEGDQISDLHLAEEAGIVAEALVSAHVSLGVHLPSQNMPLREDAASGVFGWDLISCSPKPTYRPRAINGDAISHSFLIHPIILSDDGRLYRTGHDFNPFGSPLSRRLDLIVVGEYNTDQAPEEDKERVRYGLARLVARHELELPESIPEMA